MTEQLIQEKNTARKRGWFEWAQVVCGALICIALLYTLFFRMVDVHGSSMQTTLYSGEKLVLSSALYKPMYGDIVVVSRGDTAEPLIKRVIGLPGDVIAVDGEAGDVYRNGEKLSEPYIQCDTAAELMTKPITVGEGQLFIMGDNRESGNSLDSRTIGCVEQDDVVGKVIFRVWPLDRIGGLYG